MRRTLLVTLLVLGFARSASADLTVFAGVNGTPYLGQNLSKLTWGVAVDSTFFTIFRDASLAFEAEYADTGRLKYGEPAWRTFMLSLLLQSAHVGPARFYGGIGSGLYSKRYEPDPELGLGVNANAGVKISLFEPFGIRADYRAFFLQKEFRVTLHRVYLGANFEF